jgi:PAS domain-containing protein
MAPNTAVAILLVGLALLLVRARSSYAVVTAQFLALAAALIALLTLIGYIYSALPLAGIEQFIPMAPNTALALAILCVGILCARSDRGMMAVVSSEGAGGVMARRLLPAVIVIPPVVGLVCWYGQQSGILEEVIGLSLFVLTIVVMFTALIWANAASLNLMERRRQQAEDAAFQERSLLRTLMDTVPDTIYFKDTKGHFIRTNKALADRFGLSDPGEAVGKTDFDFFTDEHAREAWEDERPRSGGR